MENNLSDKILELLENSNRPMTDVEISKALGYTLSSIIRAIHVLNEKDKLVTVKTQSRTYYFGKQKPATNADLSNMNNIIATSTVKVVDANEDLKEDIKKVENKINKIYINIISLMGVFVALFSLITINVNLVYKVIISPSHDAIVASIIINLSAVIMITALLILIRLIIINPLKK